MSIRTKLVAAFGLLLLLLGLTTVHQVRTMRRTVAIGFDLARMSEQVEQSAADRLAELQNLEEAVSKFNVVKETPYRDVLRDAVRAFDDELAREDSTAQASVARPQRARLKALWSDLHAEGSAFEAAVAEKQPQAALDQRVNAFVAHLAAVRAQSRAVGDAARASIHDRLERSARAEQETERISLAIAVGALLLSILVAAWIVHSVAEPLSRLSQATHRVAAGRFDYRFDPPRDQQFARLARDFNRMTEQLGELERMKQQFLSRTSHDLKTPLASMQEASRVLLDGVAGPLTADQRRLLQLSLESGARLAGMIGKILELSTLEAGGRRLERAPQDLRTLVRRAAELASPALAQKRVRIACHLPVEPVTAECDADGILRILDNLLENAGRVSPADGTVHIAVDTVRLDGARPGTRSPAGAGRTRAAGGHESMAVLAVEDSGPGVVDTDKERIFEAFYQSGSQRAVRRGGVGLGLAICREIARAHGGTIWVEDAPGGGARFLVALPAAEPAAERAAAPALAG
jgi:signal transduction histidine kinase